MFYAGDEYADTNPELDDTDAASQNPCDECTAAPDEPRRPWCIARPD
jgi:hypothetical protein